MSRSQSERFADIEAAIERCRSYRSHLTGSDDRLADMAYDATLRNLAVIGEAVRALPAETTEAIPQVPWAAIAGLRNIVIHEYFRVDRESISDIVDTHLEQLSDAIRR